MMAVTTVTTTGATSALCASVGLARASFYRRRRPAEPPRPHRARVASPRALEPGERQAVLDVLHSERFIDQSPAEVHATLLEEQTYLCSPRTMYRLLAAYAVHPERFVQGLPRPETLPQAVWINAPTKTARQDASGTTIVTPDDPQHGVIERPNVIEENRPTVIASSVAPLH